MLKRIIKISAITIGVLFILLNVIINFHAYKFTHFAGEDKDMQEDRKFTPAKKLHVILFGVSNARPQNTSFPLQHYETVHLQSNVPLVAWSIQTDSASKGTVVIFHGYRADKSQMIDRSDEFLKMGYNTFLVDFMGSGGSGGNSTTIGVKEAQEVKTCFDYLKDKGEQHIYLFGTSMGAAATMKAMNDYHLAATGVLLECPFGTMYQTVCARFKLMGLSPFPSAGLLMFWGGLQNGFWAFSHNPVDYAKAINCPTLLMYGEADNRVSREEINGIYNNLPGKKQLATYPLSGHEDYLLKYHDKWVADVSGFMKAN